MTTTTTTTTDTSDMLLLHRMFRREFSRMPSLVRQAAGSRERAAIVGPYALEMRGLLHVHHHGEDELLYPLLQERVSLQQDLLERMDAQHRVVGDALDVIEADLETWTTTADPAIGERIAELIEEMVPVLDEHLTEEEEQVLPLAAVHLTQAEWDRMAEHGLGALPKSRRLVILGYILADTTPQELADFCTVLPTPVRVLYKLAGKRQYQKEAARIAG